VRVSEVGRFGATEPKRGPAYLGRPWVSLVGLGPIGVQGVFWSFYN
jgi:hypothetical protein